MKWQLLKFECGDKELVEIAQPNAGIITEIGSAHIEILGSRLEIDLAKWELAEYLKQYLTSNVEILFKASTGAKLEEVLEYLT